MTTQSPYTLAIEDQPSEDDVSVVREGLHAFNRQHAADENHQGLVLLIRGEDGSVAGGLLGETYWGWLHVGILWVEEGLRGKGYGTRLLAMAEAEAVRRGCRAVYLDTLDFQAPPFYERLGYSVWGKLSDFPPGHSRYWVKKELAGSPHASEGKVSLLTCPL